MYKCDGCTRDFKTIQGLRGHQQMGCSGIAQTQADRLETHYRQVDDLQQRNVALEARVQELQKTASAHPDLLDYLRHAQDCPSCKNHLTQYNQRIVSQFAGRLEKVFDGFRPS